MAFLQLGLQFADELPPVVKEELEQLVAALQSYAQKLIGPSSGGTGVDASGVLNGQLLIGAETPTPPHFHLARLTAGTGISITNASGSITITCTVVGGITQLTGDVTAGPGSGSVVATLAASGVVAGTYGDATHISRVTVDAKGRVTTASQVAISSAALASYVPMSTGAEPLEIMSDGAGHVLLIGFTP